MYPRSHAIAGFLFCLFLLLLNTLGITHFTLIGLMIIWLSNFLIDVDHYMIYVWQKHDFSLIKAYNFYKKVISKEKKIIKNYYLCIFHTIEFLILLVIITLITKSAFMMYISIGVGFHIITDIVTATIQHRIHKSTLTLFSLIARIIRYKKAGGHK